MNFPSTYVLDKYGMRTGLTIGMVTTCVGLWLRIMINKSFWFPVMGQTLMAVAQPFVYNVPAKLSGNWFPPKQRPMATMIAVNFNILGILLGFFIPKIIVHPVYVPGTNYTDAEIEQYRKECFQLMFLIAAWGTLITALVCVTFRSTPDIRELELQQSRVNNSDEVHESRESCRGTNLQTMKKQAEMTFLEQLKALPGKNYWLATISSSLTIALFYCLPTVLGQILVPVGNENVEMLGILLNAVGIVGAVFFQVVQQKFNL